MTDLLALTAELFDIPSVSGEERVLADHLERRLRAVPGLDVVRHLDNVVARTSLGRDRRVILAGHTDTVPVNENARARIDGDVLHGLGATDMKAGVAVALALAEAVTEPAVDVTWVFYAGEEIEGPANGLGHLFRDRPDLLAGDAAIVGEPTDGVVEGGCQGTLRLAVTLAGARAHTARPWMGVNAIHRLGEVLRVVSGYEPRRPVLDGCEFREAVQAVGVEGGVAGNVVPDRATVSLNHRFAPDRTPAEAESALRALLAPARRPLRRPRHPGLQLRPRRPDPRPHAGGAGRPGAHRGGARHAGRPPRARRVRAIRDFAPVRSTAASPARRRRRPSEAVLQLPYSRRMTLTTLP